MYVPWGSKFFHFHAVFGKNLRNNPTLGLAPLRKILDPPLEYIGMYLVCTVVSESVYESAGRLPVIQGVRGGAGDVHILLVRHLVSIVYQRVLLLLSEAPQRSR